METQWWMFWGIYILYVILGTILWLRGVKILGLRINPLGFTVTYFNSFFAFVGRKLRGFWSLFGKVSYFIYGNLMLAIPPLIIIITITYLFDIEMLKGVFLAAFRMLGLNAANINFRDPWLYVVFILSIGLHEFFHGIVAGSKDIDVKSVGVFFVPNIVLGAFVNIDYLNFMRDLGPLKHLRNYKLLELVPEKYISEPKYLINGDGSYELVTEEVKPPASPTRFSSLIKPPTQQSGFVIENQEKRKTLSHIQSAGLLSNLVLVIIAAYMLNTSISTYTHQLQLVYVINVILILFNLIPIVVTDGGKVLINKIQDITSPKLGARLVRIIINLQANLFLLLVVLYAVSAIF